GHTAAAGGGAFSPDGHTLATASFDHTIKLWDLSTGQNTRTLTGHTDAVTSVAFSPDSQLIASGGADNARLWNATTGANTQQLLGHRAEVLGVAFSPNSQILATASADQQVKLWDTSTGHFIRDLTGNGDAVTAV